MMKAIQLLIIVYVSMLAISLVTGAAIEKDENVLPRKCTAWYGCHKGHCWAGCSGAFSGVHGPEWCYTTPSSGYKPCTHAGECDGCWRCSSSCTV